MVEKNTNESEIVVEKLKEDENLYLGSFNCLDGDLQIKLLTGSSVMQW